jgi:hypothetical protein
MMNQSWKIFRTIISGNFQPFDVRYECFRTFPFWFGFLFISSWKSAQTKCGVPVKSTAIEGLDQKVEEPGTWGIESWDPDFPQLKIRKAAKIEVV